MHVGAVVTVSDLKQAREFYEGALGLTGSQTPGGWRLEASEGTVMYLLEIDRPVAEDPVASFLVDDVRAKVRDFRAHGVTFLGPDDVPFELDPDGVSHDGTMRVAWMKDPHGNVLTVFQLDA